MNVSGASSILGQQQAFDLNTQPSKESQPNNCLIMSLLLPRDIDIILGKGAIARHHPGNIFLRNQLEPMKIPYQKLQTNAKKNEVVKLTLDAIIESGRRFYMTDEESPDKFRLVGLDERLRDGKLRLAKRIRKLLCASAATTTATTTAAAAAAAVIASGNFKMREREEQLLQKLQHPNQQKLEDESTARESAFDESTATLPNQCTNATSRVQNASIVPPREIFVKLPITLKSRED